MPIRMEHFTLILRNDFAKVTIEVPADRERSARNMIKDIHGKPQSIAIELHNVKSLKTGDLEEKDNALQNPKINVSKLANTIQAWKKCDDANPWKEKHADSIEAANKLLPHGSGINAKCEIDISQCNADKIVIGLEFQHMNENGMYTNWTTHQIIITASLIHGYNMTITGKDQNGIKEYLRDLFSEIFTTDSHE